MEAVCMISIVVEVFSMLVGIAQVAVKI